MRFVTYDAGEGDRLGLLSQSGIVPLHALDPDLPGDMAKLVAAYGTRWGELEHRLEAAGERTPVSDVRLRPVIPKPGKIICVGLNYVDHAKESPYSDLPTHPVLFSRFPNSLVACGEPIVKPRNSEQLDWEGEIALVIGRRARHETLASALSAVAGYALFNDASIRDYQFKSNQWLMGKTFDGTGAFGPALVTPDEVPPGMKGVQLTTTLNGQTVQQADTADMIFDVATLIAYITEGITLDAGDVVVTGTPAGVGFARKPPIYMRPGDRVTVSVDGLGELWNPIEAERG